MNRIQKLAFCHGTVQPSEPNQLSLRPRRACDPPCQRIPVGFRVSFKGLRTVFEFKGVGCRVWSGFGKGLEVHGGLRLCHCGPKRQERLRRLERRLAKDISQTAH